MFLRELISNASDAWTSCATRRSPSPSCWPVTAGSHPAHARQDGRHADIGDNGIGMDRQELIENLGTIARSGTGPS